MCPLNIYSNCNWLIKCAQEAQYLIYNIWYILSILKCVQEAQIKWTYNKLKNSDTDIIHK